MEQGADLHMAQLMPLPLNVSCFSKIQTGFTFLVPAHLGSPGKGPLNRCVCVCPGLPRWAGTRRNIHPLTRHIHPDHQTSFINYIHLLRSIASSLFNLRAWQSSSTTFLQSPDSLWSSSWSETLYFILHTFLHPNHHLFATHAHTIAACSAVIPMLCHLSLISLSVCLSQLIT